MSTTDRAGAFAPPAVTKMDEPPKIITEAQAERIIDLLTRMSEQIARLAPPPSATPAG